MMNKVFAIVFVCLSFSVSATDKMIDCGNSSSVVTTIDINKCESKNLVLAQTELNKYLKASLKNNAEDLELIKSINLAQKDWQAYTSSHCGAVYTQWRGGSIRNAMAIACKITLTQQRTHELWSHFLTYMDSTVPVLPEPK